MFHNLQAVIHCHALLAAVTLIFQSGDVNKCKQFDCSIIEKLLAVARVMARVQLAVRDDRMTDTNLSAEGVFEVEVEERCGSLGADGGLDVELVSLQNVVNILGLPVDDCPANKWIYLSCMLSYVQTVLVTSNGTI